MRALSLFTLQTNLRANMHRIRLFAFSPQPACSGWPPGFISTCFYLSKVMCNEVPTHGECGVAGAQLMVDLLVDMVDLWPVCLGHLHQARQNMLRNVPKEKLDENQVNSIGYCWQSLKLTLPMLRLPSSKAQECKDFLKPFKPSHAGID